MVIVTSHRPCTPQEARLTHRVVGYSMVAGGEVVHPYHDQAEALLVRLRRIEGQVRGIQKMIQEDRYCIDILAQFASVKSALSGVELSLLESHMRGCVTDALATGKDDAQGKVEELMSLIRATRQYPVQPLAVASGGESHREVT